MFGRKIGEERRSGERERGKEKSQREFRIDGCRERKGIGEGGRREKETVKWRKNYGRGRERERERERKREREREREGERERQRERERERERETSVR